MELNRVERIDGELIQKVSKKRIHANSLRFDDGLDGSCFRVKCAPSEAAIDVSPEDSTVSWNLGPQDLHLVVEISDSTLEFHLTAKASLYARAGFPEYWFVIDRRLIVHRDPREGRFPPWSLSAIRKA